ncbi:hypothetical protein [uncultured Clostridium sp.]|uniref:hypothetical protein n=1 Tax=uncultured Clostridium sp. TaxID=59620 RepID=UPI0026306FEE|nr:hypothetical protein [uncultured Clostridium sp.]
MENEIYGYTKYYDSQMIVKYEKNELNGNVLETYVRVKDRRVYVEKVLNNKVISSDEIFNLG